MCGIIGCINSTSKFNIENILEGLNHRGPDDSGYYMIDNKSFIGHTRLSIIDTTIHGHQPMKSKCGNYVIVFNGEIYNHNELRFDLQKKGYILNSHSDTEVVLNLFIEYGDSGIFLNKLRGMFSFCIFIKKNRTFFLARDRFGIKPLLYGLKDNSFYFASESKVLIESNIISKELNTNSISNYFQYGCIPQPDTIYKEVKYLMPGCSLVVDSNNIFKIEKYYNLTEKINSKVLSYNDAVQELREKLEEATKYHMVADVEVGAFLSGGIDSTATVALMKKYSSKQINTFSIGFPSGQKEVLDELSIAKKSASILDTNHHEIRVDNEYIEKIFDDFIDTMDQPTVDGLNTYIVSKETSMFLKVAISGLGGDEIFAGYPHFEKFSNLPEDENNSLKDILKIINKIRPNRFTDRFQYSGLSIEQRVDNIRSMDKRLFNAKKGTINSRFSKIQRVSISEINNYLLNTLLRDNDNFSMAHSLEVRPILLDHPLVEFALSIDDNFKINKGVLKSIFIDSVKDLIPEFVYNRKKSGFVLPVVIWMNTVLNDRFNNLLNRNYDSLLNEDNIKLLKNRAKNKLLVQKDWKIFILLSWIKKNKIDLDSLDKGYMV